MSKVKELYTSIGWRVLLDVFSRGLFFLVNILIARTLSVNDFGKFVYAISLSQIFYIFTDMGTLLQLVKELGESRGKADHEGKAVWKDFLDLKLAMMLVSFVGFTFCLVFLWKWDQPWIPLLALLWMLSNSFLDFNQFVCNGLDRINLARKMMLCQRSLMLLGAILPLFFWRSLTGILAGVAIGGGIGSFLSNRLFFKALGISFYWKPNFGEWMRILKASVPLGIGGAFGSWYLRIGAVFLAWFSVSSVVGEYGAAFRIYEITYIIPTAVMAICLPHLSGALRMGSGSFRVEMKRIGLLMGGMGLSWALFLFFGGTHLIHLLFGAKFDGGALALKILGVTGGLVFLNYFVTHLMVVFNFQKRHALNQILAFIVCFLTSVLLIPLKGSMGAAWSLLATECFLFILTTAYLLNATIPSYER